MVAPSPTGISRPPIWKLNGNLILLIAALEPQCQHPQRLHSEAPDHTKCIGFTEKVNVSPAQHNGQDLKQSNDVDDAVSSAELRMRFPEPLQQHAIFSDAIQDAIGADHAMCLRRRRE